MKQLAAIGVSQDFLRGTLVDAVPYAQRLPALPKGMEMHDAAEIIRMRDLPLLLSRS